MRHLWPIAAVGIGAQWMAVAIDVPDGPLIDYVLFMVGAWLLVFGAVGIAESRAYAQELETAATQSKETPNA